MSLLERAAMRTEWSFLDPRVNTRKGYSWPMESYYHLHEVKHSGGSVFHLLCLGACEEEEVRGLVGVASWVGRPGSWVMSLLLAFSPVLGKLAAEGMLSVVGLSGRGRGRMRERPRGPEDKQVMNIGWAAGRQGFRLM